MKIPKDEYSSGNRDCDCWANLYGKTPEEVQEKIEDYFNSFPPQGYGTRVVLPIRLVEEGYFFARVARWHSCD